MPERATKRLAYIDWMRGLACLLMFQTHAYDSWLGGAAREGGFIKLSQFVGTFPAPAFLFLSGISFALVSDKLRQKGASANVIARMTILRGGEIFLLALAFRVQEFGLAWGHAPWTDLLRVDVLNIIGLSIVLMGIVYWISGAASASGVAQLRRRTVVAAIVCAAAIALVTPPLWTTWRPHWHAWWLESYINGVHTFDAPQPWLFPIFPWSAFAFAGLAAGMLLLADWARKHEAASLALAAAIGAGLLAIGVWLDAMPFRFYAVHDFWHSSPNFFLARVGLMLGTLFLAYAWCRWGAGQRGFSPLIEMGKSSLLVYWVHLEFIYGGLSIIPKRAADIRLATIGLAAITLAMTVLATARNRFPNREESLSYFRRSPEREAVAPVKKAVD